MFRRQDFCAEIIGKYVLTAAVRKIFVQASHFREPAAQYDDVWIEDVDDTCKRPAETSFIATETGFAVSVTLLGAEMNFFGAQWLAIDAGVVSAQSGAGQIGFNAALATTVAGGKRQIIGAGSW